MVAATVQKLFGFDLVPGLAVALVGAFLSTQVNRADATTFAGRGAPFAATHLGGIL